MTVKKEALCFVATSVTGNAIYPSRGQLVASAPRQQRSAVRIAVCRFARTLCALTPKGACAEGDGAAVASGRRYHGDADVLMATCSVRHPYIRATHSSTTTTPISTRSSQRLGYQLTREHCWHRRHRTVAWWRPREVVPPRSGSDHFADSRVHALTALTCLRTRGRGASSPCGSCSIARNLVDAHEKYFTSRSELLLLTANTSACYCSLTARCGDGDRRWTCLVDLHSAISGCASQSLLNLRARDQINL